MSSKNVPPAPEFRISFFIPHRMATLFFQVVRFATRRFQWPPNIFGFALIIFDSIETDLSRPAPFSVSAKAFWFPRYHFCFRGRRFEWLQIKIAFRVIIFARLETTFSGSELKSISRRSFSLLLRSREQGCLMSQGSRLCAVDLDESGSTHSPSCSPIPRERLRGKGSHRLTGATQRMLWATRRR
jgi:hypothetical protein